MYDLTRNDTIPWKTEGVVEQLCPVGWGKSVVIIDECFGKRVPIFFWVVDTVKACAVAVGLEPGQVRRKLHLDGWNKALVYLWSARIWSKINLISYHEFGLR